MNFYAWSFIKSRFFKWPETYAIHEVENTPALLGQDVTSYNAYRNTGNSRWLSTPGNCETRLGVNSSRRMMKRWWIPQWNRQWSKVRMQIWLNSCHLSLFHHVWWYWYWMHLSEVVLLPKEIYWSMTWLIKGWRIQQQYLHSNLVLEFSCSCPSRFFIPSSKVI